MASPTKVAASGSTPSVPVDKSVQSATSEHDEHLQDSDAAEFPTAATPTSAQPVALLAASEPVRSPGAPGVAPGVELDNHPGAVVAVTRQVPTPVGEDTKIPRQLWGGTRFTWASKPRTDTRNGILEFTAQTEGVVYLLVDWGLQGGKDGTWEKERLTKEQLVERGWQHVGPWPADEKLSMFRKLCMAGETYRIRTNKYWPPELLSARGSFVSYNGCRENGEACGNSPPSSNPQNGRHCRRPQLRVSGSLRFLPRRDALLSPMHRPSEKPRNWSSRFTPTNTPPREPLKRKADSRRNCWVSQRKRKTTSWLATPSCGRQWISPCPLKT